MTDPLRAVCDHPGDGCPYDCDCDCWDCETIRDDLCGETDDDEFEWVRLHG